MFLPEKNNYLYLSQLCSDTQKLSSGNKSKFHKAAEREREKAREIKKFDLFCEIDFGFGVNLGLVADMKIHL